MLVSYGELHWNMSLRCKITVITQGIYYRFAYFLLFFNVKKNSDNTTGEKN